MKSSKKDERKVEWSYEKIEIWWERWFYKRDREKGKLLVLFVFKVVE
jgi:hypothetical protein